MGEIIARGRDDYVMIVSNYKAINQNNRFKKKKANFVKQLILDGYNVINKIPELERKLAKNLQVAREALIDYVADSRQRWSAEFKVCVVYDARKIIADRMPYQVRKGISIIFAEPPRDADEVIIQRLRQAKQPSSITVVSNDNKIANHVRAFGGKLLRVREFVGWLDKRKNPRRALYAQRLAKNDKLDNITHSDITEELEKLWK